MLDFSGSMTANLKLLKQATEQFLLRMLPADKGQVGAFSDKISSAATFTNDRDDLIGALEICSSATRRGSTTRSTPASTCWTSVEGRKVVLVFTDGDDTAAGRAWAACSTRRRRHETS